MLGYKILYRCKNKRTLCVPVNSNKVVKYRKYGERTSLISDNRTDKMQFEFLLERTNEIHQTNINLIGMIEQLSQKYQSSDLNLQIINEKLTVLEQILNNKNTTSMHEREQKCSNEQSSDPKNTETRSTDIKCAKDVPYFALFMLLCFVGALLHVIDIFMHTYL